MQRLVLSLVFLITISGSIVAGDIPSVDYVPPPPPPAPASAETDGDMSSGGFAEEITDEIVLAIFGIFAG